MGVVDHSRGEAVRQAREAKGWTQQTLAGKCGCDVRTIRNLEQGRPVALRTLRELCEALALDIADIAGEAAEIGAKSEVGAYSRRHCEPYEGRWAMYRRGLMVPERLYRSVFTLHWSDENRCMVFWENQNHPKVQRDYSQRGEVHICPHVNLVHLVTGTHQGGMRMITLTKIRLRETVLRGIGLTQAERPNFFLPTATAYYFERIGKETSDADLPAIGSILSGASDFERIMPKIEFIEREVVRFNIPQSLSPTLATEQRA